MPPYGLQSARDRIRNKTSKQQEETEMAQLNKFIIKHGSAYTYSGLPAEAPLDLDLAVLPADEAPRLLVRGIFSAVQRLTIDKTFSGSAETLHTTMWTPTMRT